MKEKIKFIRELAENMNENKIDSVKYEENSFEIHLTKKPKEKKQIVYGGGMPAGAPSPQQANAEVIEDAETQTAAVVESISEAEIPGTKIESPMVGTFYGAPSPGSDPFIKEGDTVTEGQTLCIVEAMKLMNEVKSSVSGKVKKILAKDGDAIKKGQVLVVIE